MEINLQLSQVCLLSSIGIAQSLYNVLNVKSIENVDLQRA